MPHHLITSKQLILNFLQSVKRDVQNVKGNINFASGLFIFDLENMGRSKRIIKMKSHRRQACEKAGFIVGDMGIAH
jgi:hypothetical protein